MPIFYAISAYRTLNANDAMTQAMPFPFSSSLHARLSPLIYLMMRIRRCGAMPAYYAALRFDAMSGHETAFRHYRWRRFTSHASYADARISRDAQDFRHAVYHTGRNYSRCACPSPPSITPPQFTHATFTRERLIYHFDNRRDVTSFMLLYSATASICASFHTCMTIAELSRTLHDLSSAREAPATSFCHDGSGVEHGLRRADRPEFVIFIRHDFDGFAIKALPLLSTFTFSAFIPTAISANTSFNGAPIAYAMPKKSRRDASDTAVFDLWLTRRAISSCLFRCCRHQEL